MMVLRPAHWTLAIIAAMALHLLVFVAQQSLPGFPQATRGGGLLEQGGTSTDQGGGFIVSLGAGKQSPGAATAESAEAAGAEPSAPAPPAQSRAEIVTPEPSEPEAGTVPAPPEPTPVEDFAAVEAPEVPAEQSEGEPVPSEVEVPETAPEVPDTRAMVPPLPSRKPKAPGFQPEFEAIERRLSAAPPPPEEPAEESPPEATSPGTAQSQSQGQGAGQPGGQASDEPESLAFAPSPGGKSRLGDASGREFGGVRQLNYEDRVLLWLKKNGGYPPEAFRFRQEGKVLLEFAISRSGEVLYFNLVKSSGFYLLDQAVKDMMRRANPVPPIPAEIDKEEMVFKVPVIFSREYAESTRS